MAQGFLPEGCTTLLFQRASQILVLVPAKRQTAQRAADTPYLIGINFRNSALKHFFKEVKFDVTTVLGGEPRSSLREWKRNGTKVAEEYCWALTGEKGSRSCSLPADGTQGVPKHLVGDFVYLMCLNYSERKVGFACSGSSVLDFGFQPDFLVHSHFTEHTARNSDLREN